MPKPPRTFVLISPHMRGNDIGEFQRLLTKRFDAWDINKAVPDDEEYGKDTRHAARQVCQGLGIVHETAMKNGVTPDLRTKIRNPGRRTQAEIARGERAKAYRAALRERYAGAGAQAAIAFATEHLGTRETNGPNRGPKIDKWITTAGLNPAMNISPTGGVPWCGCFVNACIMAAGLLNGSRFGIAAVENIVERARGGTEGWQVVAADKGQPGDLACWDELDGTGWAHVELVVKRNSGTSYVCIGGNTGDGTHEVNGEGVFKNTRTTEKGGGRITLFARPPYGR